MTSKLFEHKTSLSANNLKSTLLYTLTKNAHQLASNFYSQQYNSAMRKLLCFFVVILCSFNVLFAQTNSTCQYALSGFATGANIESGGTTIALLDDEISAAIPIGFTFQFYGNSYTNLYISSNGFVTFTSAVSGCCSGQLLPDASSPSNLIAGYWEDLNPSLGGTIKYLTTGSAPNRRMLITFTDVPHHPNSGVNLVSFQIKLYETNNVISIHSSSCTNDGGLHTQGIEDASGLNAMTVFSRNRNVFSLTNDVVTFTPIDNISPVFSNCINVVGSQDPGQCSAIVNYTSSATDNCSVAKTTVISGLASGSAFPVGTTNVSIRARDGGSAGVFSNGAGGTFSYNEGDNNQTIALKACESLYGTGNCVIGACGSFSYYYYSGHISCNCAKLPGQYEFVYANTGYTDVGQDYGGVNTVVTSVPFTRVKGENGCSVPNTWLLAKNNLAGNETTCNFSVTVNDTELPQITCPSNISVSNTLGTCSAVVTYTEPIGSDNCSGSITTQIAGLPSGAYFPVGSTINTFRVTDASGNIATCSFTVTVVDTQMPSISCITSLAIATDPGNCSAVLTYPTPTGNDNCLGSITTQIAGLPSGSTFPIGTTTNTFRVTDASGNTSTCS
ncbi:MAG TPA: HYR domain-containing protein, partial [Chitinophagaceae bacterium]|nr:HYR domain-containing protein [Chitinophagaceae bacterium]